MKDVLFKPSSPPLVGIDISTSSVKLIELAKAGGGYRVESFAAEAMPSNAITDKVIMDVDAAGDAVRKAVKRASPRTKNAAVALSGNVMTKTIQMPAKLSDKELGEQIELQADQYISQPLEEVAFDYEIMGPSQSDPELVDVLLVAARRESVDKLSNVLEIAGLAPRWWTWRPSPSRTPASCSPTRWWTRALTAPSRSSTSARSRPASACCTTARSSIP